MLTITVPKSRQFNELTGEIITVKQTVLKMEHSLVSLHKWEAMYCKPFLSDKKKTIQETIDYVKCMTITQNVPDEVFYCLGNDNIIKIQQYIDAPMTATRVTNPKTGNRREVLTAEVIYYDMIALSIPVEFEKWHLNQLLMLIQVCNAKNQPPKKMNSSEILQRQEERYALNEQRKKMWGTSG